MTRWEKSLASQDLQSFGAEFLRILVEAPRVSEAGLSHTSRVELFNSTKGFLLIFVWKKNKQKVT